MTTPERAWLPHAQALAAVALMSPVFPTMKIALREVDARTLYLARFGVAALAIVMLWRFAPPRLRGLGAPMWALILVLALLRGPLHQLLLGAAAPGVSSGILALMSATAPIHVAWMAALLLREPIRARTALALALAAVGVLLPIVSGRGLHIVAWTCLALAAAAAVIAGGSVVAARAMRARWSAWENTSISVVAAAVLSVPLCSGQAVDQATGAGATTWICILYQALAVQLLGLWLLFSSVQRLPAAAAALYQFLGLALASGCGALLLGERYRAVDGLALLFVLIAVGIQGGRTAASTTMATADPLAASPRRASEPTGPAPA